MLVLGGGDESILMGTEAGEIEALGEESKGISESLGLAPIEFFSFILLNILIFKPPGFPPVLPPDFADPGSLLNNGFVSFGVDSAGFSVFLAGDVFLAGGAAFLGKISTFSFDP